MNHSPLPRATGPRLFLWFLVSLSPCLLVSLSASAAEGRAAVGKVASPDGTVLSREAPDKAWQVLKKGESVFAGDLLLGLPGAAVDTAKGVRLTFLTDLDENSPYPIAECVAVLQNNPDVDLEFTLDRGRIDVTNAKEQGAAKVRLHVRDAVWDLNLTEPKARIGLELFGRWAKGVPFKLEPGPKDVPCANLLFLVLEGKITIDHQDQHDVLRAPPGPALMGWDSLTGHDDAPTRLDELPSWADPANSTSPLAQMRKAHIERFRQALLNKPIGEILDEMVTAPLPLIRRLGVRAMGALDDLPRLADALNKTPYPDVWDNGVLVLRHWIGRGPGQDQKLYQGMVEKGGLKPVHAQSILHLLHSFSDAELAQDETYQMLVDYLNHESKAIRGLAHWHLVRLVPEGKRFGFCPCDSDEARAKAAAKWRLLIPAGELPPKEKPADDKSPSK